MSLHSQTITLHLMSYLHSHETMDAVELVYPYSYGNIFLFLTEIHVWAQTNLIKITRGL